MSQPVPQPSPVERLLDQLEAQTEARPWILESDREELEHLYAQRQEQINQLALLRSAGALPYAIAHCEQQIAMLNKAIRYAEEQALLHARKAAGRPA